VSNLRDGQLVTDEDGNQWRVDPSFDGAFLDMHLGMNGLTMEVENRFALKCTIMLLQMFTVVAEILIQPGGEDTAGQLYIYLSFEWSIAAEFEPFFVSGEIDITPFNFGSDIGAMKDAKVGLCASCADQAVRWSRVDYSPVIWRFSLPVEFLPSRNLKQETFEACYSTCTILAVIRINRRVTRDVLIPKCPHDQPHTTQRRTSG